MANSWFRLYSEFANDPKIQMMSEAMQRRFVMLLCFRCGNDDVTLQDVEVTFMLRISNEEWNDTKRIFIAKNLIDSDNKILHWDKRQFSSDSSAERVARHREKKKEQCNVTVTPPDTDTDTDTDTDIKKNIKTIAPASRKQSVIFPPEISDQLKSDFIAQRKAKKSPLTQTALDGIKREACKAGISLQSALEMCCQRGWAGFKAEWAVNHQQESPVQSINDKRAHTIAYLTGAIKDERDITSESSRVF